MVAVNIQGDSSATGGSEPGHDPVLIRRRAIGRLTSVGQRVGYGLYLLAAIGFFFGLATGYEPWLVTTIIGSLLVGSVVLAPAIVFSFAVRAADRADRDDDW